ncbi:hypothetical protein CHARACLAT_030562 [Characodon lateralis]|uniref:Uncharacterized protein n=1 Tax=Characodon lateralis TaxID=208331 RepID=A0ABU7EYM0_9TELE|nr:hypothetical protein [Characodon lateralis]
MVLNFNGKEPKLCRAEPTPDESSRVGTNGQGPLVCGKIKPSTTFHPMMTHVAFVFISCTSLTSVSSSLSNHLNITPKGTLERPIRCIFLDIRKKLEYLERTYANKAENMQPPSKKPCQDSNSGHSCCKAIVPPCYPVKIQ